MTPKEKAHLLWINFMSRGMNKNRYEIQHNLRLKEELKNNCYICVQNIITALENVDKAIGGNPFLLESILFYEKVKIEIENHE